MGRGNELPWEFYLSRWICLLVGYHKIENRLLLPNWENDLYLSLNGNLRVVAKRTLREFWEKHNDCEQQLKSWFRETEKSTWSSINELKDDFPSASILTNNKICFNIKGNHYRLIVKINFDYQICYIRFIGTHAAYDKIDANDV